MGHVPKGMLLRSQIQGGQGAYNVRVRQQFWSLFDRFRPVSEQLAKGTVQVSLPAAWHSPWWCMGRLIGRCYAAGHGDLSRSCRWYRTLVARFGGSHGLTSPYRSDCYSDGGSFIVDSRGSQPRTEALTRSAEPVRSGMASKTTWTAWIWFVGAAVWWVSAALAVHYNHRAHALMSLAVSALFFFAGLLWLKMPPRKG